jgi:hypothetical protein
MPLWLHVTAHDAETHHGPTALRHERRDDRLEWPLAGRVTIRPASRQIKQLTTVLQTKA